MAKGKEVPGGLLGKLAKTAAPSAGAKKKDEKPRIDLPECKEHVAGFLRAAADEKDAQGRKEQFKALIAEAVEPEHKRICRDGTGFHGSVKVNDALLCYVQYNALHQVIAKGSGDETMNKITEILGLAKKLFGDDAANFFMQNYSIVFRKEGLAEDVLAKVIEAVGGQEEFNRLFEINASLVATKELHERRFTDADVDKKAKELEGIGLKRYSPSLKAD